MKINLPGLAMGILIFATMPSSGSYGLHNYSFGTGGTSGSSSSNYKLNGVSGEVSNTQSSSTNYKLRSGNNNAQQANVPNAPTFTNPSNYYNKLKFVVSPGGTSPTDTKYAIAISSDNFVTTQYVQTDTTIGNTAAYQTYTNWGGSSGQNVTSLNTSTTYKIKVKAIQGAYTESEFGPTASAATVAPNLTFSLATDSQSSSPFTTSFGNLLPATVTNASDKVLVGLTTNANAGATVYVNSTNAGLKSTRASSTISSATADLSSAGTGYGAQGVTATQTSGGPFSIASPFNGASQNVGILKALLAPIFTSTGQITGGSGSFQLKAKAASLTPSANDYTDTLTLTAAAAY